MAEKEEKNTDETEIEFTGENNTDDIELEDLDETAETKIKALREKLKACETEKAQHHDDLQRAKAEFLNTKMRLSEQVEREKERAVDTQILQLIPLCDSFDMAMMNTDAWEAIDESWRKGVEAINNQLRNILQTYNVSTITPKGEQFDPNMHEAMSTIDSEEFETDTVVEVLQNGYVRNDTVIRPAKVILSN